MTIEKLLHFGGKDTVQNPLVIGLSGVLMHAEKISSFMKMTFMRFETNSIGEHPQVYLGPLSTLKVDRV